MLSNISSIAKQVLSHHNHGFWIVCSATAMALIVGALYNYVSRADKIPLLNPMKWSEFSQYRVKKHFTKNARAMLNDWFNQNPGKPASIYSEMGLVTVLPPELADEIRNDPRLNFREFNHKVCCVAFCLGAGSVFVDTEFSFSTLILLVLNPSKMAWTMIFFCELSQRI